MNFPLISRFSTVAAAAERRAYPGLFHPRLWVRAIRKPAIYPLFVAVVLLAIAASRIVLLTGLQMDPDESWSVWQTLGNPEQIIRWTPYDWPPLFYLVVGLWRGLVGMQPVALHVLVVFVFLIGTALIYRVTAELCNRRAALLAIAAYAAMGYCIHLSTLLRAYIFLMTLSALLLWLVMRYFDCPTWKRAIGLGLCMAAMFYTHLISTLMFLIVGAFTLVRYRQKLLRWWLPGVIAGVLAMPEIVAKISIAGPRIATNTLTAPPIGQALGTFFSDYAGSVVWLWVILFGMGTLLILYRYRVQSRVIALALWVFAPIPLYLTNSYFGFFTPRYACWVMVGAAIWVGWGLSLLPRIGQGIALSALLVCTFVPIPTHYGLPTSQRITTIQGLSKYLKWGDVILLDPRFTTIRPDEWDYYRLTFFPNGGLQFVTDPTGYRRVWYISVDGRQDPATYAMIHKNRVASTFIGPWDFLCRLYEAPPDTQGVLFENGPRFHGVEIPDLAPGFPLVKREGETIHLRLWWSVDQPLKLDYSVGLYVLGDNGTMIAQTDSAPQVGTDQPRETSRWLPGQYYIEEREIQLPYGLKAMNYPIVLTVYQWWDNTRLSAPGANAARLLPIQTLVLKSWR